eukprot:7857704-Pyramimonas_sp.AAC.1
MPPPTSFPMAPPPMAKASTSATATGPRRPADYDNARLPQSATIATPKAASAPADDQRGNDGSDSDNYSDEPTPFTSASLSPHPQHDMHLPTGKDSAPPRG